MQTVSGASSTYFPHRSAQLTHVKVKSNFIISPKRLCRRLLKLALGQQASINREVAIRHGICFAEYLLLLLNSLKQSFQLTGFRFGLPSRIADYTPAIRIDALSQRIEKFSDSYVMDSYYLTLHLTGVAHAYTEQPHPQSLGDSKTPFRYNQDIG